MKFGQTELTRHLEHNEFSGDILDAIDWVATYRPATIRFALDRPTFNSFAFYVMTNKFDTLMYLYGHTFLMALLAYYEQYEQYSICAKIVRQVKQHNKIVKDSLPTR